MQVCSFTVQGNENNLKYFKPPLTNFCWDELKLSEMKTQAKLSGISPENPTGFLHTQSYDIVKLLRRDWLFQFTANTKGKACSSNASSGLWGGALQDDTKNGCVGDYLSLISILLFVTIRA